MEDYVFNVKNENSISVCFNIEHDKPFAIGEKMNELNENAYMNGYNWEAFLNAYLSKYYPDVCVNMQTDPEAGMYVAYYDLNEINEKRAVKFTGIIKDLIENEEKLYDFIKKEGDNIMWD